MNTATRTLTNTLLAIGCLTFTATSAHAQDDVVQVEIESTQREAINNPDLLQFLNRQFKVPGRSYQVRDLNRGPDQDTIAATRPVFVFPMGQAQGQSNKTVVAATLTFLHPQNSFSGKNGNPPPDDAETMEFKSVDNFTADELIALPGDATSSARDLELAQRIFDDLGDGRGYGRLTASSANNGQTQTISLNASALSALNLAIATGKQDFIIGGTLITGRKAGSGLTQGTVERIFRGSDDSAGAGFPEIKLTLSFAEPDVPAPALGGVFGLSMLATGLGGVGLATRRRKRKSA